MIKISKYIPIFLIFLAPYNNTYGDDASTHLYDNNDIESFNERERYEILFQSNPIIRSYWEDTPNIRVCAESGVTEQRLRRAIRYWESIGYEFGRIIYQELSIECVRGGSPGEISILLTTQGIGSEDHLAVTRTYRNTVTGKIIRSQIFINPYGSRRPLVLEHEIGHALGWVHYNRRYHIMNPEYNLIGHSTMGVTKRHI